MISLFVFAVLARLGSPGTPAVTLLPAAQAPSDTRTLLKLEDDWAVALVKRDMATFRRLLAAGFVYTEDDKLSTREEVLKDVIGPDTVESAHNEDMKVHHFGAAAVVTGWLIVAGRSAGSRFEHRYRFTDTWVKRAGQWQIVAAQDYLAPITGGRRG